MTEQVKETANAPMSEEDILKWSRESYQKATAHMADKGVLIDTVSMDNSRYLAPLLAIWKIKSTDKDWFWAISGDLPTDFMTEEGATDPRDAVRAFSLQWQMKAEVIRVNPDADQTQLDFSALLIGRANGLYEIYEQEELWKTS